MSLGDILTGILLHAFDGKKCFSAASLERIRELKNLQFFDLDSGASDRLTEIKKGRNPKVTSHMKNKEVIVRHWAF